MDYKLMLFEFKAVQGTHAKLKRKESLLFAMCSSNYILHRVYWGSNDDDTEERDIQNRFNIII